MTLVKHSLVSDLPEHHHTIRHLKMNDKHFLKLFDEYHQVDSEVHTIEQNNSPVADKHLESLKVKRVHLKDQLLKMVLDTENAI